MKTEERLLLVESAIFEGKMEEAISLLSPIFDENPSLVGANQFASIVETYTTLLTYMIKGYEDPERHSLYLKMRHQLYRVTSDVLVSWRCKHVGAYIEAYHTDAMLNRSHDFINNVLESFVADLALCSLSSHAEQKAKYAELFSRHETFMMRLFNALFISLQWTEQDMTFYSQLLLSPMIDLNDSLLLVSALTLANMYVYDERKWLTLFHIYSHAENDLLRQRALVGWTFSLSEQGAFFTKQTQTLTKVLADDRICQELVELQEQMFLCTNAEVDKKKIENELMPDLLKQSQMRITDHGIHEQEEDVLKNILQPNAEEEAMERMEQNLQRLKEMEKAGSDINFGGFSRMKRFPFFNQMAHWFAPFSFNHPSLNDALEKLPSTKIFDAIFANGLFCDSDKYSMVLGMGHVFDRLPIEAKQIIDDKGLFTIPQQMPKDDSPAIIRRLYLQDLYRFFNIYSKRADLLSPLSTGIEPKKRFLKLPLFSEHHFDNFELKMAQFLLRKQMYNELHALFQVLDLDSMPLSEPWVVVVGSYYYHFHDYERAKAILQKALKTMQGNVKILHLLAKVAMDSQNYNLASDCYEQISDENPTLHTLLNKCLAYIHIGKTAQAVKQSYEIYYKYPNEPLTQRVLAWSLLNDGQPQKAGKYYDHLLSASAPQKEDRLNAAYCSWAQGDLTETHRLLLSINDNDFVAHEIYKDKGLLSIYNIGEIDCQLMIDSLKILN